MLQCAFNKVACTSAWVLSICSERLMYVQFTFCVSWGRFNSDFKSEDIVGIAVLKIEKILRSMSTVKFFTENADSPKLIY